MTQDQFLSKLKENRIKTTIYLINGIRYEGFIASFDQFTIIVENEKQQIMLYKNALSTIIPSRKINLNQEYPAEEKTAKQEVNIEPQETREDW